jgi:hypothetical protein
VSAVEFIGSSQAHLSFERYLPPHPGPLPQERENHPPCRGESNTVDRAGVSGLNREAHGASKSDVRPKKDARFQFPLPAGEGEGEGERDAANQNGRKNSASSARAFLRASNVGRLNGPLIDQQSEIH